MKFKVFNVSKILPTAFMRVVDINITINVYRFIKHDMVTKRPSMEVFIDGGTYRVL